MTLLQPVTLRVVRLKNRVVVSPTSQHRAQDGAAKDWHLVHLGRFALGGAGLVFCEPPRSRSTAGAGTATSGPGRTRRSTVSRRSPASSRRRGRSRGSSWPMRGRKASERRPWHGETPVDAEDVARRGEGPWLAAGPGATPYAEGWPAPAEMSIEDIRRVVAACRDAAARAREAGFRVIEVYAAHGFLLHQFYSRSPTSDATPTGAAWTDDAASRARSPQRTGTSGRRSFRWSSGCRSPTGVRTAGRSRTLSTSPGA